MRHFLHHSNAIGRRSKWRRVLAAFWRDEDGVVIATELVLILTILVIGLIVGLTTLRNVLATELGDLGGGVGRLTQSFSFSGVRGHTSTTAGSLSVDQNDDDGTGDGSNGISVNVPAGSESGAPPGP
jgi:Flp pilus assembly pilin Flp